ncbi:MAG TPA: glycosyltransferase [Alphaproteobacteria bacterium]
MATRLDPRGPRLAVVGAQPHVSPQEHLIRVRAGGKFLFAGTEKFWVKGVTYGAFQPDDAKREYTDEAKIARDFAMMAEAGINTVRIPHTVPPRSLLDIAERHGLRVMVGLSAEQYAGYLIDRKGAPDVEQIIREKVRTVAGHPALLCYALGNEIVAPLARWIGRRRIERYLEKLYRAVKDEDPDALVTYVNYPTTEYLQLPFLDIVSMNVYLETEEKLAAYLARLQNIAGDRPLILAEAGLDAMRNGEDKQAAVLDWQIRTIFRAGCAGAVIFAWTDEWWRGGAFVDDWAFGLTTAERKPKPALAAVSRAFAETPFPATRNWPRISVVVCSYNGARTIRDTLDAVGRLDYPNYEVIVVNDGSTDATAEIAAEYPVRLITTDNRGLSSARNTGMEAATGSIVAYTDDDAYPDPHWLTFLADMFERSDHAGIGGPNLPPAGDGFIAEAVAESPGGPVQVLLTDELAEHIPGCNMAYRKDRLQAIGGFDVRYRAAGDDVDCCWRLLDRGWTLGFAPAAMVWHHRRNSVRMFWRQQKGYGKAEALLEAKWPDKYNVAGHLSWGGKIYGNGLTLPLLFASRVYHGVWGSAPFQSFHAAMPGMLAALPMMPEWFLITAGLFVATLLGFSWPPLLWAGPLFALALAAPIAQALISARAASRRKYRSDAQARRRFFWLVAALHLMQPVARLIGRIKHGLTPWRGARLSGFTLPWPRRYAMWTTRWKAAEDRLSGLGQTLKSAGSGYLCGGDYDRWDLAVRGGLFGGAKLLMAVEEHGGGAQYVRARIWPTAGRFALWLAGLTLLAGVLAAANGAGIAAAVLGLAFAAVAAHIVVESGHALHALNAAADRMVKDMAEAGK